MSRGESVIVDRSHLSEDPWDERTGPMLWPVLSDRVMCYTHQPTPGAIDRSTKKDGHPMQQAKGSRKEFEGRNPKKWTALPGDEMDQVRGKRERLDRYIKKQTGKNRGAIKKKLDARTQKSDYSF